MIRFQATFYDGKTSTPHQVTVTSTPGGGVHVRGFDIDLRAAPDEMRLAPRLGDTPRSITFVEGEKCETEDNEAVDALAAAQGTSGLSGLRHRLEQRWRAALGALVILVAMAGSGMIWGIPWLAERVAHHVPDAIAFELGAGTLDALDRTLFDPTEVSEQDQARLTEAFDTMARAAAPELPLKLTFRKMHDLPNAFALPDGTVVVTDGLVELAETDDEIKAVLAHEIGHVHHRHGLRMALESSSIALLISIYIGDASQVSTMLTALPTVYAQAGYSRGHETEADTYALRFMERGDIDPVHFATIMKKLQDKLGGDDEGQPSAAAYLSSHPPTAERIARFQQAADQR